MEGPVVVLGADLLIGKHLVKSIRKKNEEMEVREWSYKGKQKKKASSPFCFYGMDQLELCMKGAKMVFNCHEFTDFTLLPDRIQLEKHNVDFVSSVLACLQCPLVHLSSVYIQCSNRWPNVYEPERDYSKYTKEWPFMKYCSSKSRGEELINSCDAKTLILRIPLLYGEMDNHSLLTDSLKFGSIFGCIPVIGDKGGAFQTAYAPNVAHGIILAAEALLEGKTKENEVIILCDNTPNGDPYSTLVKPIIENSKRPLSPFSLPFIPLYYLYLLFVWVISLVDSVHDVPKCIAQLPDPSFIYFVVHHWTFFQTNKATTLLNYIPPFSREQVVSACKSHYSIVDPFGCAWSWQPQPY